MSGDVGSGSDALPAPPSIARSVVAPIAIAYVATTTVLVAFGLLLTKSGALVGMRAWDLDVSVWTVDLRTDRLDTLVSWAGRIADTIPVLVVALVIEAILVVRRRYADLTLLAVGLALELAIFLTVNYIVQRPRPDVAKLGGSPGTYSFPSGHIAATIVLWGGIAILLGRGRRPALAVIAWIFAVLAALAVGFSRVYRGMHHIIDVLAGAGVGVVALSVAALVSLRVAQLAAQRERQPALDEPIEVAV